jgi:hypothetical protein
MQWRNGEHAFLQLFGESALERLRLNFFENAFLFQEVVKPRTSAWITVSLSAGPSASLNRFRQVIVRASASRAVRPGRIPIARGPCSQAHGATASMIFPMC